MLAMRGVQPAAVGLYTGELPWFIDVHSYDSEKITVMEWLAYHTKKSFARLRLFAFPFGGGSASVFRNWSSAFPDQIEVCPVQLPGREGRGGEKPFTNMSQMLQALVPIVNSYADLPFAFFGHSMGALIAFELGRHPRLQRKNLVHVFVSSCRAPHDMPRGLRRHQLSEQELTSEMRRLGTPEEALNSPEILEYLMPIMRADFQLVDTYEYMAGDLLCCPVSAFAGQTDAEVHEEHLVEWKRYTTSPFRSERFAGNHFYIAGDIRPVTN